MKVFFENKTIGTESDCNILQPLKLQNVIHYVNDNFKDSNLSIDSLIDKFKISKSLIHDYCKIYLDITPLDLIILTRMYYSLNFMRFSKSNLIEISQKTGYINMKTFRNHTHKVFKEAPKVILQKIRKEPEGIDAYDYYKKMLNSYNSNQLAE